MPFEGRSSVLSEDASNTVVLSGTVAVKSINLSFQRLEEAFAGASGTGRSLSIDLGEVFEADVTLVQLIESARRTAAQSGIAIRLSAPARDPVMKILQRGGFLTDPPDARTLFWRAE
jgi:ABC-type transporter Mla MlaB component